MSIEALLSCAQYWRWLFKGDALAFFDSLQPWAQQQTVLATLRWDSANDRERNHVALFMYASGNWTGGYFTEKEMENTHGAYFVIKLSRPNWELVRSREVPRVVPE